MQKNFLELNDGEELRSKLVYHLQKMNLKISHQFFKVKNNMSELVNRGDY